MAIRRLVYVAPRFPCISTVFEQNEILGLREFGVDVTVVACRPGTARDERALHGFARGILDITTYPSVTHAARGTAGAAVQRLRALGRIMGWMARATRNPVALPKVASAAAVALAAWHRLADRDRQWVHADFGQHSATVALFLAELLGVPFSFKVHAFDIFDRRLVFRDPLRRTKVRAAARIFSEHGHGRDVLARLVPEAAAKTVVNYTAVRTREFTPLPASNRARFAALGRLVPKKGFDVLVRATAELARRGVDVAVDIHGAGPEEERIRQMAGTLGVGAAVTLHGPYRNDRLPEMLRDAVAVVVPSVITSTGDMDGVPTVIYEALALGRPVIASRLSGIPEVVRDGETGLLVPAGDPARLADAMHALLRDPARAARLADRGRRLVEARHDHVLAAEALVAAMHPKEADTAAPARAGLG